MRDRYKFYLFTIPFFILLIWSILTFRIVLTCIVGVLMIPIFIALTDNTPFGDEQVNGEN